MVSRRYVNIGELFELINNRIKREDQQTEFGRGTVRGLDLALGIMNKRAKIKNIVEVKKGEWIKNNNNTYSCSICNSWIPNEQHYYARYCLYCGADMREREKT